MTGRHDHPAQTPRVAEPPYETTRAEEEVRVGTRSVDVGSVRLHKVVDEELVDSVVPRAVEHPDIEAVPAGSADSGEIETLPDGSISIPLFEEEIVISKRLVVRERLIVRKHTVMEHYEAQTLLRKERFDIEADPEVTDRIDVLDSTDRD